MTPESPSTPGSASGPATLTFALKGEAKQLRAAARAQGKELSHSAALEQVAHAHGFRDWNALSAHTTQGGNVETRATTLFPWQDLEKPLPTLPIQVLRPGELSGHASVSELFRWARQLELIAEKVAEEDRAAMVEVIGARLPYVLEKSVTRWPDGLFHLCDRGYVGIKGIVLSEEQVRELGLPEWNEAYGQHGGSDSYTVMSDAWRTVRDADMLKRLARLLASVAVAADRTRPTVLPSASNA